jgi:hypothetical protein
MTGKGTSRDVPPEVEQATHAVAAAAADHGIRLTALDAMTLAAAALGSFDKVVVVEDETSVGMWSVEETRDAVRRRLRDRAAVLALDEGYTITAHQHETVIGLGPAGETLPLVEAATAVVTHAYHARFLRSHSSAPQRPDLEARAARDQGTATGPSVQVKRPLRPV